MSKIENQNRITKKYFSGIKLSKVFPLLKIIANQNGLNLNRAREFKIAQRLLAISVVYN